jgi:flagellar motor switch protein FliN
MTEFGRSDIERLIATCRANLPALTQSLNGCLQSDLRLTIGESGGWDPESSAGPPSEPGLVVVVEVGDHSLLCLVPESLPLPKWYTDPGDSECSRLQTLAMEWAVALLPSDVPAQRFETLAVENLYAEVVRSQPIGQTVVLELPVFEPAVEEAETQDAAPISRLYVVWPVSLSPLDAAEPHEPAESHESAASPRESESGSGSIAAGRTPKSGDSPVGGFGAGGGTAANRGHRPLSGRARLLAELPVTVSVSLAEKKVELSQLLSLTPGALIIFNKPCEELLDLYVNNQRYCQGEAVKIGEKFGLKVCKVGVKDVRTQRVLNM